MRKYWTPAEQERLREIFPDHYTADVAQMMGRTISSINGQAAKQGLHKSPAFQAMELQKQGERLRKAGAKSRFVPGQVPPNKGKKMPPELYEKCKGSMFKKGMLPHNTKYDGHERVDTKDGYVYTRVALGQYRQKHRVVWEEANGPVPEGQILVFRDGNKQNIVLDNLELITRQENMRRNSITRYPSELRSTIHLLGKLKRKINEKQD